MHPPTDSQWEAVRACAEHVLVEAGAGTGKTATVVARILYLLGVELRGERHPGPVTLADIVAITFTRQAAADLKRDLRAALRERGRRADAYAVDQARIGTIHGFCSDLVNEHALRSGRAPITGVLEEGEALAWAEGCVRDELLAALETRAIAGLDALLAGRDVGTIERWTLRLMHSDRLARFAAAEHAPAERALLELARRARVRLEARLEAEGTIDYDRMIAWTRDLLRDQPGVRALLQRRVHTLIIDEFQDTDGVQREIAYLLAEPGSGRADTPRLMLVGDPKQSIYAFRGADVTVWSGVRRDFEERGQGRVLRLRDNFRSVPSILSLVETTAGRWLNTPVSGSGQLADYEVAFHAVEAQRAEPAAPAVELLLVPAGGAGKQRRAEDRRAVEARAIATRLNELHDAGTPWRDMALLLRRWTSLDAYAGALRRAGIPVYALRDDDFLETREVLDLVIALRAIRDPRDDLAVFGFLRSPFVCLRDDTLLAIAAHTRRPFARYLDAAALPEGERVAAALRLLEELAALRDRVRAAELLDELLRRTGYLAHLALLGDAGAQAALNVRRFLQMVDGMEESSVGLVLRAIAERRGRGDRVPQARLHGEQDDVVLITSVHMAKGLDWPVVVFGDLAASDKPDGEKLLIGRDCIRIGEPDTPAKEQPERWTGLRDVLALEGNAEEKRVSYVALTRPKDRLILSGIPLGTGGHRGSVAGDLIAVLPPLDGFDTGDTVPFTGADGIARAALVRVAAVGDGGETAGIAGGDDAALLQQLSLPPAPVATPLGLTRHSATELLSFGRCERRHALKYVLGIREPKPQVEAAASDDALPIDAIARGQIVHDVLERYQEEAALEQLLEDAIGRWDEDAPPPESPLGHRYRAELADEVSRVLAQPEYASVANAEGARRELRFLQVLAGGDAMQGAIDLAAPLADGVTLIDVKTSRIEAAQAAKKAVEYAPQQAVYVSAAAALGPRPVAQFGFVFSHTGTTVASAVDATALAVAGERVRSAVARMGTVPFALAESPRECFLCGYRRARLCPGVPRAGQELAAAPSAET
ncbi:MAG TPA: UvrD-helicase domain-containing protein [Longimicrobiales bacterium]|nr:UvrD-helicase domain-containing protein [Longimicrobiales bacterium]